VRRRNEYNGHTAVMLCGWGVKAGMVRVWVWKVKLCDLLAMHFPKDLHGISKELL